MGKGGGVEKYVAPERDVGPQEKDVVFPYLFQNISFLQEKKTLNGLLEAFGQLKSLFLKPSSRGLLEPKFPDSDSARFKLIWSALVVYILMIYGPTCLYFSLFEKNNNKFRSGNCCPDLVSTKKYYFSLYTIKIISRNVI